MNWQSFVKTLIEPRSSTAGFDSIPAPSKNTPSIRLPFAEYSLGCVFHPLWWPFRAMGITHPRGSVAACGPATPYNHSVSQARLWLTKGSRTEQGFGECD